VAVSTTFFAIHGVLLEEGVEHVQGKDLRIEVAIVAGVITTEEVANAGISVAPFTISKVSVKCTHKGEW
jgi:predicted transcriptional regulator of viral defense system